MIVLMITPKNTERELEKLRKILLSIPRRDALPKEVGNSAIFPEKKMTIRSASLCSWETIPLEKALGRIAAMGSFSCPPAVPIVMPGEVIGKEEIASFKYYGYTQCKVVALYSY
jgi:arginine/lysine/ornithine decarboxylase